MDMDHTRDYAAAFESFLNHCDQRTHLYSWFDKSLPSVISPVPSSMLSIGAGTGQVEKRLIEAIQAKELHISAIEPNHKLATELRNNLPDLEIIPSTYEDAQLGAKRYDLILLSHSIYYLKDPKTALSECYDRLNTGGTLMIINESVHGIHDFRKHFNGHENMLFSDEKVQTILHTLPGSVSTRYVIDGHIDTEYLQSMLPFILPQYDVAYIESIKADVMDYAIKTYGNQIYQPSIVFLVKKP